MTKKHRRRLDAAAAFALVAFLLPQAAAAKEPQQVVPAAKEKVAGCARPSDCMAVDFDKARLSEVAFLVSEVTGEGFVFDEAEKTPAISWSQQNVPKAQLLPTFIKVLTSLGLTVHRIEGSNFWAIRAEPALVAGAEKFSSGVYHLKYLDAEAVQKSAESLYGKRLAAFGAKGSKVIAFSGDPDLVTDFSRMLGDIDQPPQSDSSIASIRLKHIPVRSAVEALSALSIFGKGSSESSSTKDGGKQEGGLKSASGIYPDYWNRSVLVSGTKQQQDMALVALSAIDKPRQGRTDEAVYLNTLTADDALPLLKDMYEALSIRKASDDRLLISGDSPLVQDALATVAKLDGSDQQVKVEAVIASLTDREFRELGTRLSSKRANFTSALNGSFIKIFPTPYSGLLLDFFNEVVEVDFAAGDGFAKGEVISSPVLTVLNGKEASLLVGQNVPFLTQKESNQSKKDAEKDGKEDTTGVSVQRNDIGLTFKIKPVIRPDGDFINLTVSQEMSSVNPESQLSNAIDLIVDKKNISSTILAGNGDMIFLGGLRYQEAGKSVTTVPLLGDIPVLGQLFTYSSEIVQTRNLVVSLRLKVVSAPEQGKVTFLSKKD